MKIKTIIIAVIILIFFSMGVSIRILSNKYHNERADKERWQGNYIDQTNIILRQKEFLKLKNDTINLLSARTVRLIDSLKIKPKTITKIVERVIIQKETDTVLIEVDKIATGTYKISDRGRCYVWQGVASILGPDSLKVLKTAFKYENNITEISVNRKLKGKFLFWKIYDRKKGDVFIVPECGDVMVKEVNILK